MSCLSRDICAVLFSSLAWTTLASADDSLNDVTPSRYQGYGFLTQGAFYARNNHYFGRNNRRVTFDFREIGLGGNFSVSPRHRVAGLLLSRDAGKTDNNRIRVDHLLLDSKWGRLGDWEISSQLGRAKTPLGLFNETRDVAATRPSILLPQSIYLDNARKLLINSDGLFLRAHQWTADGDTMALLSLASPTGVNNPETEARHLGMDHPGHLVAKPSMTARIEHRHVSGTLLMAQATKSATTYEPTATDNLPDGHIHTAAMWLGAEQTFAPWVLRAEFFRANIQRNRFAPVIPDFTNQVAGWYGEAAYHWSKTSSFIRYDSSYVDLKDKDGTALAALTGRPAHDFFSRDWTIGSRLYIASNASLSAEYHYVDGTSWLPVADNPDFKSHNRYWHLFATQFTINF